LGVKPSLTSHEKAVTREYLQQAVSLFSKNTSKKFALTRERNPLLKVLTEFGRTAQCDTLLLLDDTMTDGLPCFSSVSPNECLETGNECFPTITR